MSAYGELNTIKINANKLKTVENASFRTATTLKITVIAKSKNKYNKAVTLIKKGDQSNKTEFKFSYKKG